MSNVNLYIIIFALIATYLLACVSSAIVVCRAFGLADPRTAGSKNPGATNVMRLGGKLPAFLTLLGDVLKGFLPVCIVGFYFNMPFLTSLTALVAVLGHCFPVYYRFHGGKGVATALGGIFGLYWMLGLATGGTWLLVALLFRYSSLAALVAISMTPVFACLLISMNAALPLVMIAVIVVYRHRANIVRLYQGTESKIGQKSKGV